MSNEEQNPIILTGMSRKVVENYKFRGLKIGWDIPVNEIQYQERGDLNPYRTLYVVDRLRDGIIVENSLTNLERRDEWIVSNKRPSLIERLHAMDEADKNEIRDSLSERAREPWDYLMRGKDE